MSQESLEELNGKPEIIRKFSKTQRYRRRKKAIELGITEDQLPDGRGKHNNHARGPSHARWNNGISKHTEGYIKIQVGKSHPLADTNGCAYLHLLVWVSAGNPLPSSDELLHHDDEVKTNNRIENLELTTRSAHGEIHSARRGRNSLGQFPSKSEPVLS